MALDHINVSGVADIQVAQQAPVRTNSIEVMISDRDRSETAAVHGMASTTRCTWTVRSKPPCSYVKMPHRRGFAVSPISRSACWGVTAGVAATIAGNDRRAASKAEPGRRAPRNAGANTQPSIMDWVGELDGAFASSSAYWG